MNIGQIRYFVSVYEEGSFSRGAKKLFVTVQAASKAIADLEREIGAPLFERKSRGIAPTSLGGSFYLKAIEVLRGFEELERFASSAAVGESIGGAPKVDPLSQHALDLVLCTPDFRGYEYVLVNIASYIKKSIGLNVNVRLALTTDGIEQLRQGNADALITIGKFETPETDCVPLLQAPTGVALANSHPLAPQETVGITQLGPYPALIANDVEMTRIIYDLYRKRGLLSPAETMLDESDFDDAFSNRFGAIFCVGLPTLTDDQRGFVVRPIRKEDAIPVPICLVSLKESKSRAYLAAERFLTGAYAPRS